MLSEQQRSAIGDWVASAMKPELCAAMCVSPEEQWVDPAKQFPFQKRTELYRNPDPVLFADGVRAFKALPMAKNGGLLEFIEKGGFDLPVYRKAERNAGFLPTERYANYQITTQRQLLTAAYIEALTGFYNLSKSEYMALKHSELQARSNVPQDYAAIHDGRNAIIEALNDCSYDEFMGIVAQTRKAQGLPEAVVELPEKKQWGRG